jgi:hypothetical protein
MSSSAAADAVAPEKPDHLPMNHDSDPDVMESNHDLPARTMAEEDKKEQAHAEKDDPATTAAREELKHTSISDRITPTTRVEPASTEAEPEAEDKQMKERTSTPDAEPSDAQDEEMRERLSSPKKKRGRDQDDDTRELDDGNIDTQGSAADGSVLNGNRTIRSGPEKKRPRDTSEEEGLLKSAENAAGDKVRIARGRTPYASQVLITPLQTDLATKTIPTEKEDTTSPKTTSGSDKQQTSKSAFASSGFASLANTSTSPFGSLAANKPSIFSAGAQSTTSGFGALAAAKSSSPPSSSTVSGFGALSGDKAVTGFGFGSGATSGFGSLSSGGVFGAKLGNGFAGGAGPKLSSFAAPGKENEIIGNKPAKAFGAPESDEDDGSDEDDSEGGADTDEDEGFVGTDEKKKSKLHKGMSPAPNLTQNLLTRFLLSSYR